ncbi:DUF4956 domain-containing protein [Neiella marina]|uniref:DUF4956 domain-containing protein n=1 Tax=Neiella holothuriorum TaxID=2870530 RepID=A0ABS7ED89_9GAMM|nr:DUF4956 domain-containing protein [Neiella holothuriorum]MBW8189893.1 DUF4956 domain-containing protein [Neiella holothuriorum]
MTELTFELIFRFAVNCASICMLCYGCYYRINKNATVAGSFVLFGVGIFVITRVLHRVDMSMEFAFGLFAVFTMLRYRTETISIKGMTYLFLVTAIALLTAVSRMPLLHVFAVNVALCVIAFMVDTRFFQGRYQTQHISYERIDNIKPQNRAKLLQDLRERTGLDISSVSVNHIDFLKDTAELTVQYIPVDDSPADVAPLHSKVERSS